MITPLKYLVKEPSSKRALKRGLVLLHFKPQKTIVLKFVNQFKEYPLLLKLTNNKRYFCPLILIL